MFTTDFDKTRWLRVWRRATEALRKRQTWHSFVRLYTIVRALDERQLFFEN
jgi:hypothetical protein